MPRQRQTPRRPTCAELPPRVTEYPLKTQNPDIYREWQEKRKQEQLQKQQTEEELSGSSESIEEEQEQPAE